MGWRILTIDNAGKLFLRDNQLVFKTGDSEKSVAIEDLECVLLENQQIDITHPLLSKLAEQGVMLVSTDSKHQASGIHLSFWGQYKKLEIFDLQISASEPLKKRCWQKIITTKIQNQALCLQKLNIGGSKELYAKSKQVLSGDSSLLEGSTSAFYFNRLFDNIDPTFIRQKHYYANISLINAGLNYSYALARAVLIRNIVASGLLPYLGVHHISKINAFNLADDLIEPFRPIIDYHVFKYLDYFYHSNDEALSLEIRRELQKIFIYQIQIENTWNKFPMACRKICQNFILTLRENNSTLFHLPIDWREK
ncbi:MAG: type II CRISPR-associated endonuclease Cas1 [Brevinema sp.]